MLSISPWIVHVLRSTVPRHPDALQHCLPIPHLQTLISLISSNIKVGQKLVTTASSKAHPAPAEAAAHRRSNIPISQQTPSARDTADKEKPCPDPNFCSRGPLLFARAPASSISTYYNNSQRCWRVACSRSSRPSIARRTTQLRPQPGSQPTHHAMQSRPRQQQHHRQRYRF